MSDLKRPPKPHHENLAWIADFAEIECLRRADGSVSHVDIARIIERASDAVADEAIRTFVEEAFQELEMRSRHCGPDDGRYPFSIVSDGRVLELRDDAPAPSTYIYLLLSTRMNMRSERTQGNEDATVLFEEFCRHVAERYWGGPTDSIRSLVFGTGGLARDLADDAGLERRRFAVAVNHLCTELGEGCGFRADPTSRLSARDGKLDIVVWRRFSDGRAGQLIGFGQCKTGTHWSDDLAGLRPEAFCSKWMVRRPAVLPVRMYFVTDRVTARWYEHCVDGGILFDRCRLMEYATGISPELNKRLRKWVDAAAALKGLALP